MKTCFKRLLFGAMTVGALCFTSNEAHARLPKPIQMHATVIYVDQETQTIVAKANKDQKPFVLDWNKETDFIKNGEGATAVDLMQKDSVVIHYKRVSFRNPLLKKVIWENSKTKGQQP
jgi:hypothetical protein